MKKTAADDQTPAPTRKEEILSAAASLFRRQGFERTSVREIAQVLGMTSGSLFYPRLFIRTWDDGEAAGAAVWSLVRSPWQVPWTPKQRPK